jgi:hypothetical protein
MDLYKADCFVPEAKQGSHAGTAKIGIAVSLDAGEGRRWMRMRAAA